MKKTINIRATTPVTALSVPVRGSVSGVVLETKDIFRVICQKALVDEVLADGSLVRLDLANYDKDFNSAVIKRMEDAKKALEVKVVPPVVEPPKQEVKIEPVVQTTAKVEPKKIEPVMAQPPQPAKVEPVVVQPAVATKEPVVAQPKQEQPVSK